MKSYIVFTLIALNCGLALAAESKTVEPSIIQNASTAKAESKGDKSFEVIQPGLSVSAAKKVEQTRLYKFKKPVELNKPLSK